MSGNNGIRVLVTGASGFIAAHIVQQLLREGYIVRGTVRSLTNPLKVGPLRKLGDEAGGTRLELVEADLMDKECWGAAVKGCTHVCHTASPFPMVMPRNEQELIKPAVEGTLNVLRACSGRVKRVVLTSSVAAVGGHHTGDEKLTENDWTDPDNPGASPEYARSKYMAEKAAWDYLASVDDSDKFELAVLNPSLVLGPVLTQQGGTSIDLMRRLMSGRDPMIPRVSFTIIDVRDVARAHVVALTLPEAAGHRHLIAGHRAWFRDLTTIMREEFGPQGYNPPLRELPLVLAKILSWFDASMNSVKDSYDVITHYDNTRMRTVLKIEPRPLKGTIIEMVYSLIECGSIPKTEAYKGRPSVVQ